MSKIALKTFIHTAPPVDGKIESYAVKIGATVTETIAGNAQYLKELEAKGLIANESEAKKILAVKNAMEGKDEKVSTLNVTGAERRAEQEGSARIGRPPKTDK